MHARRAIVNAAAAACANLATTGSRCHPGRSWPVVGSEGPHLLIYARRETSSSLTMKASAHKLMRECRLFFEGIVTSPVDNDEILDTIADEVETAVAADHTLGGTCKAVVLTRTDIDVSVEAEHRVATIVLEFAVTYYTEANAPSVAA